MMRSVGFAVAGVVAAVVGMTVTGAGAARLAVASACAQRPPLHLAVARTASATATLAFVRYDRGSYGIFVMTRAERAPRRLSAAPAVAPPVPRQDFQDMPAWSPDGRRIAFTSDRSGDTGIYVIGADGGGTVRLSPAGSDDSRPSWSPDGRMIVFARGDRQLWLMRPDGRGARPLTRDPLARDSDPAWSPDGSRIAFVRRQPRLGAAVFLVGPDGRGLCRLTPFSVSAYTPAWAPDATRLAYVTGDGRGFGLELVNADGSGRRLLTPQRLDFNPAWSPDGSEIAFSREASLYLIRPDGSRLERLTSGMIDDNPAWRPLTS